VGVELLVVV